MSDQLLGDYVACCLGQLLQLNPIFFKTGTIYLFYFITLPSFALTVANINVKEPSTASWTVRFKCLFSVYREGHRVLLRCSFTAATKHFCPQIVSGTMYLAIWCAAGEYAIWPSNIGLRSGLLWSGFCTRSIKPIIHWIKVLLDYKADRKHDRRPQSILRPVILVIDVLVSILRPVRNYGNTVADSNVTVAQGLYCT